MLLILIFIVAIFLRVKVYFANSSMWLDECSLAMNLLNNKFIGTLENGQVSPTLFLLFSKLSVLIFGVSEFAIRLVPFLCSIFSIFAFYFLSRIFFKKNYSILIANFLFAINYQLIYYAQEFKQYSCDVFIAILLLIFINKIDFEELNIQKSFLFGAFFSLIFWVSFTSIFIFVAFFGVFLFRCFRKYKDLIAMLTPFVLNIILYYTINLRESFNYISNYSFWKEGFINLNFSNFLYIIVENINYFFYPCKFVLFALILIIIGLLLIFRENKNKFFFILLPVLVLIISSYMHIYPFQQRVVLFLIPILLILILKPLDILNVRKKISFVVIGLLFSVYFSAYFSLNYYKQIGGREFYKLTDCRSITKLLSSLIKSNENLVLSPSSKSPFDFYSKIYPCNYSKKIVGRMPLYNKDFYLKNLDIFPKGKYWFYIAHDVSHSPIRPFIKFWSKGKKTKEYKMGESYLIYIEK